MTSAQGNCFGTAEWLRLSCHPGENVIKLYLSSITERQNQRKCLSWAKPIQAVLTGPKKVFP
jgi:hypothetical protein